MALNYDSPLIDNTTGSPTLDSLKSGSDKINGALTEIKEEVGDLYGRDSILGTVSETDGVPTGAIIDSGSNSDGYWSQFADGTQIETVRISEVLDSSLSDKGDVTNFDMDRPAPLSSYWSGASYSCHGRGLGGGGSRSDLALAGRLNENVKVYRPIGLVTSATGDVTTTSAYINIDLQLITRWF